VENVILAIVFFTAAFICLAIEAFILPGFGVVGVLGLILLAAAIIYAWITLGALWGIGMLALSALLFGLGIWIISKTRFGRRFVQGESLKGAVSSIGRDHTDIVGKEGAALSDLHPVGSAMVEGRKLDVITNGVFIKKGSRLRVIEASGPRIVVEEIKG
jgi:membrane-bound serine protease (ClpP class)